MTQPIDFVSRRRTEENDAPASPPTARPSVREIDVDALTHGTFDYGVIVQSTVPVAPTQSPTQIAQSKLDTYRRGFDGPYVVDGASVSASPQFRMAGGFNDAAAGYSRVPGVGGKIDATNPQVKELNAICAHVGVSPQHALTGAPTARELVTITQALITAGKLASGPGDVQTRIKDMQWKYGIGIDCTDYVIGAAMKANAKSWSDVSVVVGGFTLPIPGTDYFSTADTNPHLSRVTTSNAKTGDVFCLDSPERGEVGHRAVVYSNEVCDANRCVQLWSKYGAPAAAFLKGGPVHEIQVDASWGAGPTGASFGGVRRDTWFYNESSHEWAQLNARNASAAPTFEVTANGPAGENLHGVYRFR